MDQVVWLIGTSSIADEYLRVLQASGHSVIVIGRSEEGCSAFYNRTGVMPYVGGLAEFLNRSPTLPAGAINAVGVMDLNETTKLLLNTGVKNILVEKPGGISFEQICSLSSAASDCSAKVFIAYNRRFFNSVVEAKRLINIDGGALYCRFDFTEAADQIASLKTANKIKSRWLYGNSTHVIDTVFHLIGRPLTSTHDVSGSDHLSWHSNGAIFRGFGESVSGCMFSYHSDWRVPGRWGIEIGTSNYKLNLCPMEELHVMKRGSFAWEKVVNFSYGEEKLKAGFNDQVEAFLSSDDTILCSISEHLENFKFYKRIANYND